jgi:high-affinity nickel-transport protein
MCLIDTIDGALMLSLYIQPAENFLAARTGPPTDQYSRNPRDPIAFLYYSIVLTSLTVIVAIVIGVLQLLTMIANAAEPEGKFWDGVGVAGEYYDVIGGAICGCFIIFGGLSVFVYRPWRRWVNEQVRLQQQQQDEEAGVAQGGINPASRVERDADSPIAGSSTLETRQGMSSKSQLDV